MAQAFFSNLFGQAPSDDMPPESVLAEWKKYSVEQTGPSSSDQLIGKMEEGHVTMKNFVSTSLARAVTGAQGMGATVQTHVQTVQLPSTQQFVWFFAFLGAGAFFLILAFTLFLPVIILAPSKFALCFTLGSALVMGSFVSLKGWRGQLTHMFSRERLPFTAGYLGSMGGTLYAALGLHSYLLSLACCGLQVVALLYYLLSYFPGGTAGVRFFLSMAGHSVRQCLGGVRGVVFR